MLAFTDAAQSDSALAKLMATLPQTGRIAWIGLRPAREVAMLEVDAVEAVAGGGLVGDRYAAGSGKRGVTIIAMTSGRHGIDAMRART